MVTVRFTRNITDRWYGNWRKGEKEMISNNMFHYMKLKKAVKKI